VTHAQAAPRRLNRHHWIWLAVAATLLLGLTLIMVPSGDAGLTINSSQRTIIDRLESVLLHDTAVSQYDRMVNPLDERGFVGGIGDFSTAGGGVFEVVQTYTARVGPNVLSKAYLITLARLAADNDPDVKALAGLPDLWALASTDRAFRLVQEDVLTARFFDPALRVSRDLGLTTVLGFAIIYDSMLQHGREGGPDSLQVLIDSTTARTGGKPDRVGEHEWLAGFLSVREEKLINPVEPAHKVVWPYGIGRVKTLRFLLDEGHDDLTPPIAVTPYGTRHVLDLDPIDPAPTWVGPVPVPTASMSPSPSPTPTTSRSTRPPIGRPGPSASSPVPLPRMQGPIVGLEGYCLDVNGGVSAAGNYVQVFECNGTAAQLWTAETDGTLRAVGLCMQVQNDSLAPGTAVEVQPCDGQDSQQWRFSGGHLINPRSALCLAVPNDSVEPARQLLVSQCNSNPGQQWARPGGPA
jgi:hypothetical protein